MQYRQTCRCSLSPIHCCGSWHFLFWSFHHFFSGLRPDWIPSQFLRETSMDALKRRRMGSTLAIHFDFHILRVEAELWRCAFDFVTLLLLRGMADAWLNIYSFDVSYIVSWIACWSACFSYPDANHGFGIYLDFITFHPKTAQFCRWIFQHHGSHSPQVSREWVDGIVAVLFREFARNQTEEIESWALKESQRHTGEALMLLVSSCFPGF